MTTFDIDRWEPLTVDEAADLFRNAPFRWWIAGGYALELHTARSWRTHADIDISICGSDTGPLRSFLAEWDFTLQPTEFSPRGTDSSWTRRNTRTICGVGKQQTVHGDSMFQ